MVAVTNDAIFALLQKLGADVGKIKAAMGLTVPDADLDGKYGDPLAPSMPKRWTGDNFKGAKFSDCPPELLDMLAERWDYFAKQNDEKKAIDDKGRPKSTWDKKNAMLARGWADRKRSGWVRSEPALDPAFDSFTATAPNEDDVPF